MKIVLPILVVAGVTLATGCAAPKVEDMTQLNGAEVTDLLNGNTRTYVADWGRWAQYYSNGITYGKASGSWGTETGTGQYAISDEGEYCEVYEQGDNDWANPEYTYCGKVYVDENGKYYHQTTRNDRKPERVGTSRSFDIHEGDHYGLAN